MQTTQYPRANGNAVAGPLPEWFSHASCSRSNGHVSRYQESIVRCPTRSVFGILERHIYEYYGVPVVGNTADTPKPPGYTPFKRSFGRVCYPRVTPFSCLCRSVTPHSLAYNNDCRNNIVLLEKDPLPK